MAKLQIFVDFPKEDERITSNVYTFRIGTLPQASKVEICLDHGAWLVCRPASGYWWYDWISFTPGEHHLIARAQTPHGETATSKPRRFKRTNG